MIPDILFLRSESSVLEECPRPECNVPEIRQCDCKLRDQRSTRVHRILRPPAESSLIQQPSNIHNNLK